MRRIGARCTDPDECGANGRACAEDGHCCSRFGQCGTEPAHCGYMCQVQFGTGCDTVAFPDMIPLFREAMDKGRRHVVHRRR